MLRTVNLARARSNNDDSHRGPRCDGAHFVVEEVRVLPFTINSKQVMTTGLFPDFVQNRFIRRSRLQPKSGTGGVAFAPNFEFVVFRRESMMMEKCSILTCRPLTYPTRSVDGPAGLIVVVGSEVVKLVFLGCEALATVSLIACPAGVAGGDANIIFESCGSVVDSPTG
uniref:Uncharacterized protein n=1 Tax=Echinococcus granulosus TaxID=6210 RepID=A0A068WTX9_ECHGR|nr:hypothetical protein EgrG_002043600 [Echinococcus granulosus]